MSGLKVVVQPAATPVSLDDARAHLRVDHYDDDIMINAFLKAATIYSEKFLGRALIDQTLDYYLDAFPTSGGICLPRPPLIEVEGVFYQDSNGAEHEFLLYSVNTAGDPGKISLMSGVSWPSAAEVTNAVRIRYRAGYLDTTYSPGIDSVPESIGAAILLTVGTLYAQRETIVVGQSITSVPWSAEQLLRMHRFDLSMA